MRNNDPISDFFISLCRVAVLTRPMFLPEFIICKGLTTAATRRSSIQNAN